MAVSILFEDRLAIPPIASLADFRRWALSEEFPQTGRIDYIAGQIEVDMSPEDYYLHGRVKSELFRALSARLFEDDDEFGDIQSDRTRISSVDGDLSAEPDIVIISQDALNTGRVRLVPKANHEEDRFIEVEGAPDLIVEVVSDSSVSKDRKRLPRAYFTAGVREFWLVDAPHEEVVFQVHRRGATGFEVVDVDNDGFQFSEVLDRRYRLERQRNQQGRIKFRLYQKLPT